MSLLSALCVSVHVSKPLEFSAPSRDISSPLRIDWMSSCTWVFVTLIIWERRILIIQVLYVSAKSRSTDHLQGKKLGHMGLKLTRHDIIHSHRSIYAVIGRVKRAIHVRSGPNITAHDKNIEKVELKRNYLAIRGPGLHCSDLLPSDVCTFRLNGLEIVPSDLQALNS